MSGAVVWLIGGASVTVGASGLVFGLFAFLLVRGFFNRNWWQILLSVVLFMTYGGILFGVLPTVAGYVSWQAHLGGAVGGVLAALLLSARGPAAHAAHRQQRAAQQRTRPAAPRRTGHNGPTPAFPLGEDRRRVAKVPCSVLMDQGCRCQPAYGLAETISTVMSLPFGAV